MELHLEIIGVLLIALATAHLFFPKYFNWHEELESLSLINRQMMKVHTFFIALVILLIGLLCFSFAEDMTQTKLGKALSLGLGFFWAVRLIFQLFVYSRDLWKGKTFETTIHIAFTILWVYLTSVFLTVGLF